MIADLDSKFEQAKSARAPYEPEWMLNKAFFAGQHWVMYANGRVTRPRIDPRRQLVTDNRITPIVTSRVAKKVKNRPMYSATPQTADDSAIDAARVAERVLENDWDALGLQAKMFEAMTWGDIAGDGFLKVFWDSTLGEKRKFLVGPDGPLTDTNGVPLRPEDALELPPEIASQVRVETVAQGDVAVEVITPFELYPDPLATSMDSLEWMIEEKVRSVEYLKRRYPVDAAGNVYEPTPDAEIPSTFTEGWFNGQLISSSTSPSYRGVKLREYWCRPNSEHPNGYRAVWANGTLLVADDEPFDPMPYVKFPTILVPGRFWSHAVVSDLRGPNQDLNTIRTQIKENARRLGNPALMRSRQANVRYEGTPGEIIDYDSTVQDPTPSYLEPPSIPVYVENEITRIEKSMEEISGMHEVSRATVPPGVTAASAINLLQEADETRIGPEIHAMERGLASLGTKDLKLRARFNTDERLIKIAGDDGNWDIFAFKGEMLGGDPEVEVQAGSSMPRSKAAKQAAMTEVLGLMLQYGVPIDERSLRKFLKDYEVGGLERLFEGFTEDAKQVNRENRQLLSGEAIGINAFDNHEFHIAEHTEFQKSNRYYRLPDDKKMIFDAHVAAHRQTMVEMVNQQLRDAAEEQAAQEAQQLAMTEQEMATKAELDSQNQTP